MRIPIHYSTTPSHPVYKEGSTTIFPPFILIIYASGKSIPTQHTQPAYIHTENIEESDLYFWGGTYGNERNDRQDAAHTHTQSGLYARDESPIY